MTSDVVGELRRLGVADVDDSTLVRALYSTDASLYRVVPQVVVRPRSVEEVLATVEACRLTGTPLTSRGAGTSIAGNAVGTGVVIDFTRHLNRVHDIDVEARTARVDPGTVHAVLQKAATPLGLRFGPDPSTHTRCTVGGMIGNNACGSRALAYGRTADNVVGLDVVTMAGEQLSLGAGATYGLADPRPARRGRAGRARHDPDRVRQVRPPGLGLQPRAPAARAWLRRRDVPRRHRGDARDDDLGDRPARRGPAAPADPRAGVRLDGRRRRRRAGAAAVRPDGVRGPRLPHRRRLPYAQGLRARPAPRPGLAVRRDLRRRAGTRRRHRAARGRRVVGDREPRRHRSARAGRAVAHPRGGRRARDPHAARQGACRAGRTPPFRPTKLGTYLREFDALLRENGLDGVPYGHFGDGCIHVRIDFPLDAAGRQGAVPVVHVRRRDARGLARRIVLGGARRRARALRAAAR